MTKLFLDFIILIAMGNNNNKQLINNFKTFILEKDLTLQQIGLWLKMHPSAIANIINGNTKKPHDRTLYKIKKLIGEQ